MLPPCAAAAQAQQIPLSTHMARLIHTSVTEIDVGRLALRGVSAAVPFVFVHGFEAGEAGTGVQAVGTDVGLGLVVRDGAVGEAVGFAFECEPGGDDTCEGGVAGGDVLKEEEGSAK